MLPVSGVTNHIE